MNGPVLKKMPKQKNEKLASEKNLASGNKTENALPQDLYDEKKSTRFKTYKKWIIPPRPHNTQTY